MGTHGYGYHDTCPRPLDKYDTRARPVPSWVPTIRVSVSIEVSMGTHEFLNLFIFWYK